MSESKKRKVEEEKKVCCGCMSLATLTVGSGRGCEYVTCTRGCRYDVCVECIIKFGNVYGEGNSLHDVSSKCFICKERLYIGKFIPKLLKRRVKFNCKLTHVHDKHKAFIIFKTDTDHSIGIAKISEEIIGKEIISYELLNNDDGDETDEEYDETVETLSTMNTGFGNLFFEMNNLQNFSNNDMLTLQLNIMNLLAQIPATTQPSTNNNNTL